MRYTPHPTYPDQRVGTFHTEATDTIPELVEAIEAERKRTGWDLIGVHVYRHRTPRPGKKWGHMAHVRPGDGVPTHTATVAHAIEVCAKAGVEFWALAPAYANGVGGALAWAVRDGKYVVVTSGAHVYDYEPKIS